MLSQLAFSLRQDYFRWSSGPVPQNQLAVGRRSTQPEQGPVAFDQVHVAVHAEVAHPNIEMTMGGLKQWQQRHQFMCKDLISMWRANLRWRATVLARAWCVWNLHHLRWGANTKQAASCALLVEFVTHSSELFQIFCCGSCDCSFDIIPNLKHLPCRFFNRYLASVCLLLHHSLPVLEAHDAGA